MGNRPSEGLSSGQDNSTGVGSIERESEFGKEIPSLWVDDRE